MTCSDPFEHPVSALLWMFGAKSKQNEQTTNHPKRQYPTPTLDSRMRQHVRGLNPSGGQFGPFGHTLGPPALRSWLALLGTRISKRGNGRGQRGLATPGGANKHTGTLFSPGHQTGCRLGMPHPRQGRSLCPQTVLRTVAARLLGAYRLVLAACLLCGGQGADLYHFS